MERHDVENLNLNNWIAQMPLLFKMQQHFYFLNMNIQSYVMLMPHWYFKEFILDRFEDTSKVLRWKGILGYLLSSS